MDRVCPKCNQSEFYKSGQCAVCARERRRLYRQANRGEVLAYNREYLRKWRKANPEKVREQERRKSKTESYKARKKTYSKTYVPKWREANRERSREHSRNYAQAHREQVREKSNRHYRENRERYAELNRQWRESNRERVRENNRRWQLANPENRKARTQARRARIKNVPGRYKAREWLDLKAFYDYTCLACHKREPEIKLTPDHVKPIAKGGSNSIDNIQPLCLSCNQKKHVKEVDYR